jgi:hypothetical protein
MYTVRQKRWLYSDVRYVKWASFETSYNGIKCRKKTMNLGTRWRRHDR